MCGPHLPLRPNISEELFNTPHLRLTEKGLIDKKDPQCCYKWPSSTVASARTALENIPAKMPLFVCMDAPGLD